MSSGASQSSIASKADWGPAGERGSAFRGLSKGRGGPSRGRGRGASRGGGRPPREPAELLPQPTPAVALASSKPATARPTHASLPEKPNTGPPSRPRAPRRTSRSTTNTDTESNASQATSKNSVSSRKPTPGVPSVVVQGPQASSDSPSSTRPSNRRRRSQNHGKPQSSANVAPDDSFLRPQKSRSNAPRPLSMPATKDAPPHLAHMKTDIDALVERVRAVAMAENRPTTPGSHIDWAGEDDDSLPDLDDWGVTTTRSAPGSISKSDLISPIMMDGLKALPDPVNMSSSPSPKLSPVISPSAEELVQEIRSDEPLGPKSDAEAVTTPKAQSESLDDEVTNSTTTSPDDIDSTEKSIVSDSALKQSETSSEGSASTPKVDEQKAEDGLSASIHAPKDNTTISPLPPSSSSPTRGRFPATHHTRFHGFGRGGSFPHSQSTPSFHRSTRSGSSTPVNNRFDRGGTTTNNHQQGEATHNRTHSTPPAGRVHASRPVITGDAISRLARTIGGIPNSHIKSASVSVVAGSGSGRD